MKEKINALKAEIFDILRCQEAILAEKGRLDQIKATKIDLLDKLVKQEKESKNE